MLLSFMFYIKNVSVNENVIDNTNFAWKFILREIDNVTIDNNYGR